MHRNFYAVTRNVSHLKSASVVKTLDGIMSFYSFSFYQVENQVYYRYLPCVCKECLNGNAGKCKNIYLCGQEYIHRFKMAAPKQWIANAKNFVSTSWPLVSKSIVFFWFRGQIYTIFHHFQQFQGSCLKIWWPLRGHGCPKLK